MASATFNLPPDQASPTFAHISSLNDEIRSQNAVSCPKRRSSRHLGAAERVDQTFLGMNGASLLVFSVRPKTNLMRATVVNSLLLHHAYAIAYAIQN